MRGGDDLLSNPYAHVVHVHASYQYILGYRRVTVLISERQTTVYTTVTGIRQIREPPTIHGENFFKKIHVNNATIR